MTGPAQHYSPKDVAGLLSVSKEQVLLLITDGALPAVDVGRGKKAYWRVSSTDVDAYLAAERAKTARRFGKSA